MGRLQEFVAAGEIRGHEKTKNRKTDQSLQEYAPPGKT